MREIGKYHLEETLIELPPIDVGGIIMSVQLNNCREDKMKTRLLIALFLSLLLVVMAFGACAKTTTVTVPAKTITIPAVTSVLPAVTVTLPGKITTIPATTVIIPSTVTVLPATTIAPPEVNTPSGFLPAKPINITAHMASVAGDLTGDCVTCHGPTGAYYLFPLPPDWDGAVNGSLVNAGYYYVVAGSIQDHTGRTNDSCLTCHNVVKS
jgi:hypothetical protein